MARMIFVNLPVSDVARAAAFYEALGFRRNPMFSNEQASAVVWSDEINVMLLDRAFYATFTDKTLIDAHTTSGVLLAISQDSREEVDAITEAALAAGGRETRERQDMGYMYGRAFEDPDGHVWEPMFMNMAAAQEAMGQPDTTAA
ncbi:lactoylglutathione lyase [Sphingomonas sp. ABOLG]|uniref:VOC family protein n=1 Tax=Sphingomonas sp. ABOLG TaxID=1985880 RepID=UPI000F7EDCC9|nr:VOC family protein [Sphingomonas sp. ABOLG]RSV13916.1 lactoylglutathione lyase [Sphingomonas sp. ABOLG]